MRSLASVGLALGLWAGASCSPSDSAPADASGHERASADVQPVAPILDWSSVATRTERERAEAKAAAQREAASSAAARRSSSDSAEANADLYRRLPKDSLWVLALSDLEHLGDLVTRSEVAARVAQVDDASMFTALREPLADMSRRLSEWRAGLAPEWTDLIELATRAKGRAALSMSGLTPDSIAAAQVEMPVVFTVIYDAGADADRVAATLAPCLAVLARDSGRTLTEKPAPVWGCEIGDAHTLLDFERRGNTFELRIGGREVVTRELIAARKRVDATSFLGSRVAADAARPRPGTSSDLLELHVQLTPLWDLWRNMAQRARLRSVARTGLAQFQGLSLAIGRTEHGLSEALTLHSPAGVDLISHALSAEPLDTALARAVPPSLPRAVLFAFDGTRLLPDVSILLSTEAQSNLVRALADFRRNVGVDFERDLLNNFGPSFVVACEDPQVDEAAEFVVACNLHDAGRAQRTINALLVAAGLFTQMTEEVQSGVRLHSLPIQIAGMAEVREVHWCVHEGKLLVASSASLLRQSLGQLHAPGVAHAGLDRALTRAGPTAFAVGYTAGGALPESICIGRPGPSGPQWIVDDGGAWMSTMVGGAVLSIGSAVAIPKLIAMRIAANHEAAAAQLQTIADAQVLARDERALDQDHDGRGESLFLNELAGAVPARGQTSARERIWCATDFQWTEDGVGLKSGYCFRIDLATRDGRGLYRPDELGGPDRPDDRIDVDAAEVSFVAYAWPQSPHHGTQVYVFDSKGGLFSTDNRGGSQGYDRERAPRFAAHLGLDGRPGANLRTIGRDGGTWLRLRGP